MIWSSILYLKNKKIFSILLKYYNIKTGSGKTYTMFGDLNNKEKMGIIPRLAEDIFVYI